MPVLARTGHPDAAVATRAFARNADHLDKRVEAGGPRRFARRRLARRALASLDDASVVEAYADRYRPSGLQIARIVRAIRQTPRADLEVTPRGDSLEPRGCLGSRDARPYERADQIIWWTGEESMSRGRTSSLVRMSVIGCICASASLASGNDMPRPRSLPEHEDPWLVPPSTVRVEPSTGAAIDAIPLPLPRLPSTLAAGGASAPPLTLTYNHVAGNGPVGVGWALELGHIEPSSLRGVEPATASRWDVVYPGGAADMFQPAGSSVFLPRIQRAYFQAQQDASGWHLWDSRGAQYDFGSVEGSRRWNLTAVTDRAGNRMTATYVNVGASESYLSTLDYTSNTAAGIAPSTHLVFERSAGRLDAFSSGRRGELATVTQVYSKIQVWTHGVHQYDVVFNYSPDPGDKKATSDSERLLTLRVQAPDGSNVRVLRSFQYSTLATALSAPDTKGASGLPISQRLGGIGDMGVRAVDVDGDGYADLVNNLQSIYYNEGRSNPGYFTTRSDAYSEFLATEGMHAVNADGSPGDGQLIDVDADGRPDIVQLDTAVELPSFNHFFRNTGTVWAPVTDDPLQKAYTVMRRIPAGVDPWISTEEVVSRSGWQFVDVNGDRHLDLVLARVIRDTTGSVQEEDASVLLQLVADNGAMEGFAFSDLFTQSLERALFAADPEDDLAINQGVSLLDINGDGLADILSSWRGHTTALLNNGQGWQYDAGYAGSAPVGFDFSPGTFHDLGLLPIDYNADGLVDFIQSTNYVPSATAEINAFRNTGTGWVFDSAMADNLSSVGVLVSETDSYPDQPPVRRGYVLGDYNGDGRPDLLRLDGDAGVEQFHWLDDRDPSTMPRLLTLETNELGGQSVLSYANGSFYGLRADGTQIFEPSPRSLAVVGDWQRYTYDVTSGSYAPVEIESTRFDYESGYLDARGFRGFGKVTATPALEPTGTAHSLVMYYASGDGAAESLLGQMTSMGRYEGPNKRQDQFATYQATSLGGGRSTAQLLNLETRTFDATDPSVMLTDHTVHMTWDTFGHVTQVLDYGYADDSTDDVVKDTVWTQSADARDVDIRTRETVSTPGSAPTIYRDTYFYYDMNTSPGVAAAGLPTRIDRLINGSSWATESIARDAAGRIHSSTDADGVITVFGYDLDGTAPSSVDHGAGEVEHATWSPINGLPLTTTDRNGRVTTYQRDVYGMLSRIIRPGDEASSIGSATFTMVGLGSGSQYLETIRPLDASHSLCVNEYLDGFGRLYHVEDFGTFGASDHVVQDYQYDDQGHVSASSYPHLSAEAAVTRHYAYDYLGRPTASVDGDGAGVTVSYNGRTATATDRAGHPVTRQFDVRGNTVSSSEVVGGRTLLTRWTYDVLGQLVTIVDPAGAITIFDHDLLGRRTGVTDPDVGHTVFLVSPAGRLAQETRSDGTFVTYDRDTLGRVVLRKVSDGSETTYTYGADPGSNSIGRLARAEDAASSVILTYDGQGREASRTIEIDGTDYTLNWTHLSDGGVNTLQYPDGTTLVYSYDWLGRPSGVSTTGGSSFASGAQYDARNMLTYLQYGNGVATWNGYDATLFRPSWTYAQNASGSPLINREYFFDANGNLSHLADFANPMVASWDMSFNEANQLTEADRRDVDGTYAAEQYAYDLAGNLVQRGGFTFDVDATHPHQVTCMRAAGSGGACPALTGGAGAALGYDGRGNVTSRNDATLTHDVLNRVVRITSTSSAETLVYGPLGDVVHRTSSSDDAVLAGRLFEQHSGYYVLHIPFGDSVIASQTFSGTTGSVAFAMGSVRSDVWWRSGARGSALTRSGIARGTAACVGMLGLLATVAALVGLIRTLASRNRRRYAQAALRYLLRQVLGGRLVPRRRLVRLAGLSTLIVVTFFQYDLRVGVAFAESFVPHTVYYHTNLQGSVGLITDEAGSVARRTEYQPYGQTNHSATYDASMDFVRHGFQSSERSELTDVHLMGARHYDASLGRFLEHDTTIPDASDTHQLNPYAFAAGNPVRFVDPSGHGVADIVLFAVMLAVAVAVTILTAGTMVASLGLVGAAAVGALSGTIVAAGVGCAASMATQSMFLAGTIGWFFPAGEALAMGLIAGAASFGWIALTGITISAAGVVSLTGVATNAMDGALVAAGTGLLSDGFAGHWGSDNLWAFEVGVILWGGLAGGLAEADGEAAADVAEAAGQSKIQQNLAAALVQVPTDLAGGVVGTIVLGGASQLPSELNTPGGP